MASLKSGTTIGGYTAIHTNNISSYALTSAPSVSQLISPNGATVVGADQAMPNAGHSFIHTLALGPGNNDGHILSMTWAGTTSIYGAQIFIDTDPNDIMAIRSRSSTGVWTSWKTIIHSGTIGSQSVNYASSAGNADTTDGLRVHGDRNNEADKIVRTDSNGYIQAGWINTTSGDRASTVPNRFYGSDDDYIRYYDRPHTQMYLGLTYHYSTARRQHTTDTNYWVGTMGWGQTDWNSVGQWGSGFVDSWSNPANKPPAGGHHVGVQSFHYRNGSTAYGWQLAQGEGTGWYLRRIWGGSWSGWYEMITSENIGSQSVNYATTAGSANSVTWGNVSGKPSLDYQQEYTFTAPASTDGSGYSWVRISMGGFNAGGDFVRFSIARAIGWNGASPYGGPSMDVVAYSREWHGGQEGAVITYAEHGSVPGSGWVTNAGPRDLAGGGYWFYMRIWGGVDYAMRVYRGSGPIGTSWESTSDPGSVFALRVGVNNIGSTHTGFNTTGPIYGSTLYNGTNAVIHAGNIASQSVSYATSSGNSVSTDQTNFSALFIEDAPVATKEYVTSQGYLTSLPSHNHDDRYYTETESDGRFQPLENQRLSTGNGPTFANVYTAGWFRNYGNQGIYNETYGTHFYSNASEGFAITGSGGVVQLQFRSNHQSTIRGHVYADTSNQIGFLNNGGGWSFRTTSDRNAFVHGQILTINADNAGWSSIYMNDGDEGMRELHCNSNRIGFLTQAGAWGSWCDDAGGWNSVGNISGNYLYSNSSVRVGEIWGYGGLYRSEGSMLFGVEGGAGWSFRAGNSEKVWIGNDGNIYMAWAGAYISTLLDAKQNASTAINTSNISSQSVNYATSAGSASSSSRSSALDIVGYGSGNMTYYQTSGTFAGYSGWAGYFVSNHGDGATYYNQTIIMPFWGPPQYSRLQGGTFVGPYTFWSTENLNDYAPNMNQYVRTTDNVTFNTTTSPTILVNNHSDNTKGYRIHNTSGTSVSAMFTNSSNQLVIAAGAVDQVNLNKKVLVNGVALGVNVSPSGTAGRIDASNDIVAYSSSDERLKYNISPIENALDKVKSLTGVEFDWKPEYKHAHGYEGHDTGIIAQQVEAVMPSAVRTNDTGFLAVRYEKLIGLLIEGMKEQQAQIDELKAKLDGLTK